MRGPGLYSISDSTGARRGRCLGYTPAMSSSRPSPLTRLLHHFGRHLPRVKRAAGFSVANKVFDLAPPGLIGAAVDTVVNQQQSFLASVGIADPAHQLTLIAVLTVIVWALESITEYAYGVYWRDLAQDIQHELRLEAWDKVLELDADWISQRGRGETMSVLNDDINQLERFLDGGANDLLQVTTTAVVVGGIFVVASPGVALWAIAPVPFILVGSFLFQSRIAPRYARVRREVGRMNALLSNALGGMTVIRSFTGERRELERLRAASERYREANHAAILMSAAFSPLIRMVIVVGFTATLLVGGWMTLGGTMAVGTYSVLVFLTQRLLWPLTRLGTTFDLYQRAMASTERVLDVLDTPVQITDGPVALPAERTTGRLHFDRVDFAYPGRERTLHGVELEVPAGRTVAIVGSTGSGKTTLVRLLLRLHEVQGGAIRIDGHDIRSLSLADLRTAVAVVSQQTFLFPGTVFENIAYGRPGATRADVERAARLAEAHDFVQALPQGYDTPIGEDGHTLSGGQRQRLSLARAVLKNAPVLVLDEATSAVDNETEAAIQRSMVRITADRTTLVIAHRLSTVRNADEIVVLEHGRVVERGTHDALIGHGGAYARLWAVQTGELLPQKLPGSEPPVVDEE